MLKSHMSAVEKSLIAIGEIPANSGHTLHKGTPREAFVKEYLESHLPSTLAIGTGEIIDAHSQPNEQRNQYDIVIYRRSYPKLDFGGDVSGFLVESVIATIEVKSLLTKQEFGAAAKAAFKCKNLKPKFVTSFQAGYVPPAILNYIVAYDGPAQMNTVRTWIKSEYNELGIPYTSLPLTGNERINTPADAIDAVFILGRGFLYYDNVPIGFSNQEQRERYPASKWIFSNNDDGNLMLLFLMLQVATANIEGRQLDTQHYVSSFNVPNLKMGE